MMMEEELVPAKETLDDDARTDIIYECYDLLQRIVGRSNPQWLQSEGLALIKKLEVTLSWHKIH